MCNMEKKGEGDENYVKILKILKLILMIVLLKNLRRLAGKRFLIEYE